MSAVAMGLNLVMLGPPGAGKGTQALRLARAWAIPHISTGAILREAVKAGTPLGLEVKAILESGGLVDDALVSRIVFERLDCADAAGGFLLDGFPRTVPQAEGLDTYIGSRSPLVVLEIVLSDSEVLRRLAARMVCSECSANSQDDSEEAACHDCGGRLVPRADDKEQVVRNRLEVYHRQTAPLVDYYRSRPTFCRVEGHRLVDDVTRDIFRALHELPPNRIAER
jgi:adenylate kinase